MVYTCRDIRKNVLLRRDEFILVYLDGHLELPDVFYRDALEHVHEADIGLSTCHCLVILVVVLLLGRLSTKSLLLYLYGRNQLSEMPCR